MMIHPNAVGVAAVVLAIGAAAPFAPAAIDLMTITRMRCRRRLPFPTCTRIAGSD